MQRQLNRHLGVFGAAVLLSGLALAGDTARPKIRAITGFVDLDAKNYAAELQETVTFLNQARDAYQKAGWAVSGIRITTQPFPEYTRALSHDEAMSLLRNLSDLAGKLKFGMNIGPAMVKDSDDTKSVDLLAEALSMGLRFNGNLITAADDGIHWNGVKQAARLIKYVSEHSPKGQGNFNFGAIAMMKPYGPFYPGSYSGGGRHFAIGLEGASVVAEVFAKEHDPRAAEHALSAELARHLVEVEKIATTVAAAHKDWIYSGIDPTPAPLGDDSIGTAIESFVGGPFGSSGTETASAIITRAVQSVPVKRTGYSGLMIPVLEDNTLTKRWGEGTYTLDSILAYSAVCAGGVDTVPLPGDVTEERLARIIGDVATLAFKWNKPLAARLLPSPGRKVGEMTEFGGQLRNTIIQPLSGSPVLARRQSAP
jgi:uncharacterized protein (UPF0210 family)